MTTQSTQTQTTSEGVTNTAAASWMELPTNPERDARLRQLKDRDQVLPLSREDRMRWFQLQQVFHPELERVTMNLAELLSPNNDIKIISIIGPTGIGKTTLAASILTKLVEEYGADRQPHEVPFVYVTAPANGDRSMSWKVLYRRIMTAAGTPQLQLTRPVEVKDGEMFAIRASRTGLAHLREQLEAVIKHRNIRVLVIDEAMHLLRFRDNGAIMDTLKSLADVHDTKLVLIGTYQIAPLMIEYGQLARRSTILHYRRYLPPPPNKSVPAKLSETEQAFKDAVGRLQNKWPCAHAPNLEAVWMELMRASLGSIGLLKSQLLQWAWLQMQREGEALQATDVLRAIKPPKQLAMIERETAAGEAELAGACYGEADFGSKEVLQDLLERVMGRGHA